MSNTSACGCCSCDNHGHVHAEASAVDFDTLGETSDTRALYRIMNMDCPMEEALIRKKLESMPGIRDLEFNLMQRVLTVHHDLDSTAAIEVALRSIDMHPEKLIPGQAAETTLPETKTPWGTLIFAGVLAAFSEAAELMVEGGLLPSGGLVEYTPMLLALLAIGFGGLTTYRKGWIAVKNFNLNINALMSVAVTGALLIGQFPEAAMVMVLFNLAEAIEAKSLDKARKAIKNLLSLAPEKATVLESGAWAEKEIRHIAIGSRIRVRPGEKIAMDGVLVQGQSAVNQAPITGESMPVEKQVGDVVYAGTINETGSFEFEVSATATNSTLARIIHAVEEAQASRAPTQRFVDQFAKIYTPAVFLAALLVAVVPPLFLGGAWQESIYTALVLLVIGCPCALVISTPVTIVSGMAAATRMGILVKGGMFLEQGRKMAWLALDKTGTITLGKPSLTDFIPLGSEGDAKDLAQAQTLAQSLASRSDHPVSKAIARHGESQGITSLEVSDFTALPGQGVSALIQGQKWYLGNHSLVEELGQCSPALEEKITFLEKQGKSVVALIGSQGVLALMAVADTLRPSSAAAIAELRSLGIKTLMLTGDNSHTAKAIAQQVGVDDFAGNLLPQDKLTALNSLAASLPQGKVMGMVGDGINDAPALARADIGFAMAAAGTDTAIETADVALMDDDLRKIPRFIRLSRATHAILVQNITLALGVKALFLALALAGQATMWMAVFADVGTSLLVVANGLRAIKK